MTPLYDALVNYNKSNKARFHMPGHSGTGFGELSCKFDVTEIPDLDCLLQPETVILEAERLLANCYGSKHSLMVTSGSTMCVQIVINALKLLNIKIVAFGQMHNSFYNALKINGLTFFQCKSLEELEELFFKNKDMFAVFLTSPDYFGVTKDVELISDCVHKKKNILVVDEAHGSHFVFSKLLPNGASNAADISFTSMHKTMPAIGGSALINCNVEKLYNALLLSRSICHSTSPSYLSMVSMDLAREEFEKNGELYYRNIKETIDGFNGNVSNFRIVPNNDFSRLVLQKEGMDCYKVLKELHKKGFDIEMAYFDKLVLIVTPYNYMKLNEFAEALGLIKCLPLANNSITHQCKKCKIGNKIEVDFIKMEDSVGRVSYGEVGIYPPSVPLLHEGDIIDQEIVEILIQNREHLFGLVNGMLPVLK